ncbi:TVP38/TMEM64 family protein [Cyanobacteria bacterium FACHB-DQ100]|uniref:TVP38/TMEM64 family protein n=1 Tax=Leptolyngbya sp. DQ-M1 TaxID=2933920 RepID=UPI0019CF46DB|nr:TVP38/TMEM64 family protein [Cyanobacteria bacterium FACHB-DQ100]
MLQQALTWIQNFGALGTIVFMALYVLAAVLFIPGTILTLGAGAVFGVVWGSIYVFVGASCGAIAAFLIGRYLARGWVTQRIEGNPKFKAIDEAVAASGLKIVILTRLSPVFPFTLLNYAFGVTRVTLRDYAIGCVGMIPGTVMYVYIGSLAGSLATIGTTQLSQEAQSMQWAIRIVGLIATVIVSVYVTRIARKALQDNGLEQN